MFTCMATWFVEKVTAVRPMGGTADHGTAVWSLSATWQHIETCKYCWSRVHTNPRAHNTATITPSLYHIIYLLLKC